MPQIYFPRSYLIFACIGKRNPGDRERKMIDPEDLVPDEVIARELHQTKQTLASWRCNGKGPPFFKVGRKIFYRRSDVRIWLATKLREPTAAHGP
jgi:hypothetical protein